MMAALNFAGLALVALTLLASAALWARATERYRSGQPLLDPEPAPLVPWGLVDLLVILCLYALIVESIRRWLFGRLGVDLSRGLDQLDVETRAQVMLVSAGASLVSCIVTAVWLALRHRTTMREFGVDWRKARRDVVIGLATFAMFAPLVYGLQSLLAQVVESVHPLLQILREDPQPYFFVVSGFAAVAVAPVAEEFFFRLVLQGWFERVAANVDSPLWLFLGGRTSLTNAAGSGSLPAGELTDAEKHAAGHEQIVGHAERCEPAWHAGEAAAPPLERRIPLWSSTGRSRWPLVLSSLLFALPHAAHGPDPIPLFVLALGLGYLYRQTGRLLPCIVVHLLLNACTLAMMWLAVHSPAPGASASPGW